MKPLLKLFGPPRIEELKEKRNINGLVKAVRHTDPDIRKSALAALASLGEAARMSLIASLKSSHDSTRQEASAILEQLNWEPTSPEEKVYSLVAQDKWALVATMGETAFPSLIELLGNRLWNIELRAVAAGALGILRSSSPASADALFTEMEGESPELSSISWLALAQMNSEYVARRAMSILRNERAAETHRIDAAQLLPLLGKPAVDLLIEVVQGGRQPVYTGLEWGGFLLALGSSADPRAVELFRKLQPTVDDDSRKTIDFFLKIFKAPPDSIISALGSSSPGERMIAATVLGQLRESKGVGGLVVLLDDDYPNPRVFAAIALGRIGGRDAVAALIRQLDAVGRRGEPFARRERALIMMALGGTKDSAVIEGLSGYVKAPDRAIRAFAELVIEKIRIDCP